MKNNRAQSLYKFFTLLFAIAYSAVNCEESGISSVSAHRIDVKNVVGVTILESSAEYTPIAVQYGKVGVSANRPVNSPLCVTNLVFTANLEPGDMLYAFDHAENRYHAYILKNNASNTSKPKAWEELLVYNLAEPTEWGSETKSEDMTQDLGYGFWIHRPNVTNRIDRKIYLAGQVHVGDAAVTANGSTSNSLGKTLFGNPFNRDWDINTYDWSGKALKWDTIQVHGGGSTIFQYNGASWVKKTGGRNNSTVIRAGSAFWYQRGTTSADAQLPIMFEFDGILFEDDVDPETQSETR